MMAASGDYTGFLYVLLVMVGLIVVFFLLSVVIEAAVLSRLKWGRFRRTWWYSLVANLASTILIFWMGERVGAMVFGRDLDLRPTSIVGNYAVQVVVEAVVLLVIARRGIERTVPHILLANLVSVAILLVLIAPFSCFV